jgi:hypothetical protein
MQLRGWHDPLVSEGTQCPFGITRESYWQVKAAFGSVPQGDAQPPPQCATDMS